MAFLTFMVRSLTGGGTGSLSSRSSRAHTHGTVATISFVPTYEYACTKCGQHVEVFQRVSDEPLTECGVCGGPLRKVFHPAGILFKGSGFYSTDNRSKSSGEGGSKKSSDGSSSEKSSSSEKKSDSGSGKSSSDGSGSSGSGSSGSGSSGSGSSGSGNSGSGNSGSGSSGSGSKDSSPSSSSGSAKERSA
ncbi:MAG: FmdB family zinc ribbon protein [Actinomycetota bacterium]